MLQLKLARITQGHTQFVLSLRAGISQGRYSMIERHLVAPTPNERERIAKFLNVPATTLFRCVRYGRQSVTGASHE